MNIIHVTSPEKKLHFVSRVGIASKPHQKYANYANDSNIVVHYFFLLCGIECMAKWKWARGDIFCVNQL